MPRVLSRGPRHDEGSSAPHAASTARVSIGAVTAPVDVHLSRLDKRKSHIQISEIWMWFRILEVGCLSRWRKCRQSCTQAQKYIHRPYYTG